MKYLILKKLKGDRQAHTSIIKANNRKEAKRRAKRGIGVVKLVTSIDY